MGRPVAARGRGPVRHAHRRPPGPRPDRRGVRRRRRKLRRGGLEDRPAAQEPAGEGGGGRPAGRLPAGLVRPGRHPARPGPRRVLLRPPRPDRPPGRSPRRGGPGLPDQPGSGRAWPGPADQTHNYRTDRKPHLLSSISCRGVDDRKSNKGSRLIALIIIQSNGYNRRRSQPPRQRHPPGEARSGSCWSLTRGGRRSCSLPGTSQGSGTSGTGRRFLGPSGCTTIILPSAGRRPGHERRVALAGFRAPGARR